MHSFSMRDDISVCSGRSSVSISTVSTAPFRRGWSFSRKDSVNCRDDLSEYSSASSWGDGPGPLSLADYRLQKDGLQARRSAAEAVIRAEWERQLDTATKLGPSRCAPCLGTRARSSCRGIWRRSTSAKPGLMFTWLEVQSLVLLPVEDPTKPYLMAITTFRLPEEKKWLLQAGSLRGRARWAIEMVLMILKARHAAQARDAAWCKCYGVKGHQSFVEAFPLDAARVACETARSQPSLECMERLAEVLYLLAECEQHVLMPHIPKTALQRFGGAAKRAKVDFHEWQQWLLLSRMKSAPPGLDAAIWKEHLLPFLQPCDPTLRDASSDITTYPPSVDQRLSTAAERCQRTMS